MKKEYVKPTIHIVNIDDATVLASSTMTISSGTTSDNNITEADSRRGGFSVWDDEGE